MDGASILTEPVWHIALTVPARDFRAREWAIVRGFTVWLPECIIRRQTRRGLMGSMQAPLFPGYLFVHLDDRHPWRKLAEAPAVVDLLKFNCAPAMLPRQQPGKLRRLVANGALEIDENSRRRFAEDDPIRLTGGMWDGWEGL